MSTLRQYCKSTKNGRTTKLKSSNRIYTLFSLYITGEQRDINYSDLKLRLMTQNKGQGFVRVKLI